MEVFSCPFLGEPLQALQRCSVCAAVQRFGAEGRAVASLEVDLLQAGGFAGGFFQAAVSHEMVLWDRGHCHPDTAAGPSLQLLAVTEN